MLLAMRTEWRASYREFTGRSATLPGLDVEGPLRK